MPANQPQNRLVKNKVVVVFALIFSCLIFTPSPKLDGEWIHLFCILTLEDGITYVIRPDGSEAKIIAQVYQPRWQVVSPDGRGLIYQSENRLYKMSLGSHVSNMLFPYSDSVSDFGYAYNTGKLYMYMRNPGKIANHRDYGYSIYEFDGYDNLEPTSSFFHQPRGGLLAYFIVSASGNTWLGLQNDTFIVRDMNTGLTRRIELTIPSYKSVNFIHISPDGRYVNYSASVFQGQEREDFLLDLETDIITKISEFNISGFIWSPDGQQIAYAQRNSNGLYDIIVSDVDFTNARKIHTIDCKPNFVEWRLFK
jgi:WD40 repeat protein